jgi:hypothetical protein
MPKKRIKNFIDPNTSKPSSSTLPLKKPSRSVNERLAQLRAEQAPRPTIEHRNEIAALATAHSMPPALRHILQLPETAPLQPTIRSRRQRIINGRRAPPGPAPPESWLASSQHAPANLRAQRRNNANKIPENTRHVPTSFNKMANLADLHPLPKPGTLVDKALKAMAIHWDQLVEYEQFNLSALPPPMKASLLSYIGLYGSKEGVTSHDLRVLFLGEHELLGATGSEEVSRLDLTGLMSDCFTINDLRKFLIRNNHNDTEFVRELEGLSLETGDIYLEHQPLFLFDNDDLVLDSWEEGMDVSGPSLAAPILGPRFPNLTRLSLANAGTYASWQQLLLVSPQLSTLTHLSLAYWPTPNEMPNSKTSFITHNHARIPTGGTHLYSEINDDWQDPANVLRRFSNNTYSLKWLDLEGCNDWLPALTWTQADDHGRDRWAYRTSGRNSRLDIASRVSTTGDLFEELQVPTVVGGPDWNGSWAQIRYINVSQGVIPCDVAFLRSRPATVIAAELLFWLREKNACHRKDNPLQLSSQLRKDIHIPDWLEKESLARSLASTVRLLRKSAGGTFCTFDHGWSAPVINIAPKKADEE